MSDDDLSSLTRLLEAIGADRPRWHLDAACRGLTPDLFFPTTGESVAEAQSVCAGCEVQAPCAAAAIGRPERFGVWGGTTERQRRKYRGQQRTDEGGAAA